MSDVLYKVNCGQNRSEQVIHCDRIKLYKQQVLREEHDQVNDENCSCQSDDNENIVNSNAFEEIENVPDAQIEQSENLDNKRIRRKPRWVKDYVFSCRPMSNTKKTPNKGPTGSPWQTKDPPNPVKTVCAFCLTAVNSDGFNKHLVECYNKRIPCSVCGQTFKDEI